jgi:Na+/H+ antiporter NhaC
MSRDDAVEAYNLGAQVVLNGDATDPDKAKAHKLMEQASQLIQDIQRMPEHTEPPPTPLPQPDRAANLQELLAYAERALMRARENISLDDAMHAYNATADVILARDATEREKAKAQKLMQQAEQLMRDIERAPEGTKPPLAPPPQPASTDQPKDPRTYDLLVLLPAVIAILLAIFSRQVVPALFVSVVVGAYMLVPCLPVDDAFTAQHPVIGGFRLAAEKYVVGAIVDPTAGYYRVKIIVFTLVIGFTIGVMGRSGGTAGLVKLVAGETESPRRGALTAWLAGLVVFFDDYANTMIVGPTMRSVFDRLKLSRAKLAYIVDSTAAPVASLAIIGTWVGAEIGFIQVGLDDLTQSGAPAFLVDQQGNVLDGMRAFLGSLPYRFYPILALFLVFLIALTGRDFGPMRRSEGRMHGPGKDMPADATAAKGEQGDAVPRWWLGLIPILVLVGGTIVVLIATGRSAIAAQRITLGEFPFWEVAYKTLSNADAYLSIFYGALFAAISALGLTMVARACSMRDAADAGLKGMARMSPALVILVLAWALSGVEQDLMLGQVVSAKLQAANFPAVWAPLAIFVCAAAISFATGTSWGTMGILCPVAVTIAARLAADIEPDKALTLFYAAVGSVLAGAIFGDHCSPISDTTVLSSVASGCRHEEHVWTQLPYAIVGAIAAMGLGDVLCSVYDQPWYNGLGAGAILLVLIVLIVGRRTKAPPPSAPTGLPDASTLDPAPAFGRRIEG